MKICMVAACLAGGGAERALLDTAILLRARNHDVSVLTFEGRGADAYTVPEYLNRMTLDVQGQSGNRLRGVVNNLRRIRRLRTAITRLRPDVVVSYLTRTNIICLLALLGTNYPVVATEHNAATLNDSPMLPFWQFLKRFLYPHMAQVVIVSKGMARHYSWLSGKKLAVIHNFLPPDRGGEPETFEFISDESRYIVGMGRLAPEKRFDRLIRAFQLIEKDCPGWKLLIAGEGPLRADLTRLIASLELQNKVMLPGRVRNPRTFFKRCDMFALSSETEGFSLVLLEAMSAAIPVVSFDCDFGPREIITPGLSGLLVPPGDTDALALAIKGLVDDGAMRARLGAAGHDVLDQFSPHTIMDQWEALLLSVAAGGAALAQHGRREESVEKA